jgi:bifunctional NMN adenylyltransferase/nudix hydrolase
MKKSNKVGVIVGRYQVHELHKAHQEIIEEVISKHDKVILFLGVSPVLGSTHDPLDFTSRKRMIQEKYPDITILAIPDMRNDDDWSKTLDTRIREVYPIGGVIMYGGRDSFIKCYNGQFETKELAARVCLSGTEIRKHVSEDIKASKDWRAGVIYGTYNRYPISYQTVDIAVFNDDDTKILLARKPHEEQYRFIGGFVSPTDPSLEYAAKREFTEEAGGAEVEVTDYVGSFRVDDWRYRVERDKIMTTLFKAKYIFGPMKASDDIAELRWVDFDNIDLTEIVPEHRPMMLVLIRKVNSQKKPEKTQEALVGGY